LRFGQILAIVILACGAWAVLCVPSLQTKAAFLSVLFPERKAALPTVIKSRNCLHLASGAKYFGKGLEAALGKRLPRPATMCNVKLTAVSAPPP